MGTAIAIDLLRSKNDPVKRLDKDGPEFPRQFPMSSLTIRGFVKGNWPVFIVYQAPPGTLLLLTVDSEDRDNRAGFMYRLPATTGRESHRLDLPGAFGTRPIPALYTLRALTNNPRGGVVGLAPLRVYGLCVGNRAVSSLSIDNLRFGPAEIRYKNQPAQWEFRSRQMFPKMVAEFMLIKNQAGFVDATLHEKDELNKAVRKDEIKQGAWRPKKDSVGDHFLQIRGWWGKKDGDWAVAWSDDVVKVSE